VGVVTSSHGAAVRDILHVLERRFPGMPVLLYPTAVQGEGAAAEIAAGIRTLNELAPAQRIDVLIVGRGGGSVEDLWAFNEEVVARAVHASEVPVISAVGHEVDYTIADFVADVRAPTPSAAAELAVPNRAELLHTVETLRGRMFGRVEQRMAWERERWAGLRARLGSPEQLIRQTAQRVDDLRERLEQTVATRLRHTDERLVQGRARLLAARPDRFNRLHRQGVRRLERSLGPAMKRHAAHLRERLAGHVELLESLSPLTVMARGYSAAFDRDGRLVRSVEQVRAGDALTVRLHDGHVQTEVTDVAPGDPGRDPVSPDTADSDDTNR